MFQKRLFAIFQRVPVRVTQALKSRRGVGAITFEEYSNQERVMNPSRHSC